MIRNYATPIGKIYGPKQHNEIDAELKAIREHGIGGHHVNPHLNNFFQHPEPLYA